MALTVRDLFLTVRIEDRATRPLRGIAGQLNRMAMNRARVGREAAVDLERRNAAIQRRMSQIQPLTMVGSPRREREFQRSTDAIRNNATKLADAKAKVAATDALIAANMAKQVDAGKALATQQAIVDAGRKAGLRGTGIPVGRQGVDQMQRELTALQRGEQSARERAAQTISRTRTGILDQIANQRKLTAEIEHRQRILSGARGLADEQGIPEGEFLIGQTPIPLFEERLRRMQRQLVSSREAAIRMAQSMQTVGQDASIAQRKIASQITAQQRALDTARKAGVGAFSATGKRTLEEQERVLQRMQQTQTDLAATGQRLARTYEVQTSTVSTLRVSEQALIAERSELIARTAALMAEQEALAAEMSKNAAQIQRLAAVEQRFSRLQGWQQRAVLIRRAGQALAFFGGAATVAFGIAAKQAADFNTQVRLAATQAVLPGRGVQGVLAVSRRLQTQIMNLIKSGRVVSSPAEQARAAYEIFSGVTLKGSQLSQLRQGVSLLKEFNKVVVANFGLVTLEEATRAGIVVLNNFGATVKTIPRDLNTMQAAVRFGRLTMSEFVATLNQAAPAARGAHYNFTQMAAAIAFVSRVFPSVRIGATGYARLLEAFSRKDVVQGLRSHGVEITRTVNGVTRLLPITEIAARVLHRFHGQVKEGSIFLQNFFKEIGKTQSTVQARRVLVAYVTHLGLAQTILKQVTRDTGELNRSQAALQATPAVRLAEAMNQFRGVMLEVGAGALPIFADIGRQVVKLIDAFNNLSPSTRRAIGYFAAAAAVGTLLGGILITVVGGIASLVIGLRLLMTGRLLGSMGTEVEAVGAEAGFAATRFAIWGGALSAVAILLIKYPGLLHTITDALGGTRKALDLLGTTLIALAIGRRFGLFESMAVQATMARTAVMGLQVALRNIAALAAIVITIDIITRFLKDPKAGLKNTLMGRPGGINPLLDITDEALKIAGVPQGVRDKTRRGTIDLLAGIIPGGWVATELARHFFGFGKRNIDEAALIAAGAAQRQYEIGLSKMFNAVSGTVRTGRARMQQLQNQRVLFDITKIFGISGIRATPRLNALFRSYEIWKRRVENTKKALGELNTTGNADYMGSYARWRVAVNNLTMAHGRLLAEVKKLKGQALAAGAETLVDAASKMNAKVTPSFQKLFSNLIRARILSDEALAALKKTPTLANRQAYFRAYNALLTAQGALEENVSKQKATAAEKAANVQADALQKQQDNVKTAVDNVSQMYQDLLQQNQSALGQLFSGPWLTGAVMNFRREWGLMPTGADLLKDINQQVAHFGRFENSLNRLRRRGAPPELINQLRQLGPEALPMIEMLTKMQPSQWKAYVAAFQRGQALVKAQTMRDLHDQLELYRKFGQNVGKQIVLGLQDQNAPMKSEIKRLVLQMFPELQPRRNNQRGNAAGNRPPAARPPARRPPAARAHQPGAGGTHHQAPGAKTTNEYHYHDHWNIHQKPSEDIATALQRVRFRQKNRPRIRR